MNANPTIGRTNTVSALSVKICIAAIIEIAYAVFTRTWLRNHVQGIELELLTSAMRRWNRRCVLADVPRRDTQPRPPRGFDQAAAGSRWRGHCVGDSGSVSR